MNRTDRHTDKCDRTHYNAAFASVVYFIVSVIMGQATSTRQCRIANL